MQVWTVFGLSFYLVPSSFSLYAERIVLVSSNYHPHYAEDLPQQGAVTEIVRQAFALQGIQIDVVFMPFGRAIYESKQGNYTGLIAAWYDDERVEHFLYSQPMYLVLSKQDPRSEELMERFNRGLQQLQASHQYRAILNRLLPEPTVEH